MLFQEIIRMALSSVAANKLRSILTMLGITIGVFSVVGVMTAINALQASVASGLSFLGSNMFQFAKYPAFQGGGPRSNEKYRNRPDISFAQAQRFKQLMADRTSAICLKTFRGGQQAVFEGRKTNPDVQIGGTDEAFITANSFTIDYGRNLTPEDVDLAKPVIVIGKDIEKKLFFDRSPIGKAVKLGGHTYTVVGVFAPKGGSFGESEDGICAVPVTTFLQDYGSDRSINIAVQSYSQENYNATLDAAIGQMRVVRGLAPEDDDNFEIYSNDSLVSVFNQVADVIGLGAFLISAISLVAAGVGIMNIMLVSVTERTKEIGVRKSLGARKADILRQFLIESVVISVAGGLLGIALGVGGGNLIALLMKADFLFPWMWASAGLIVCAGIGIGFGFYPAWKAASLDPIEALRYE